MQIRFRLAEILEDYHDTGRGTIKKIADVTGLERHQISAMLRNDIHYMSLKCLSAICAYLIQTHHMNPYELPGRLFSLEPEDFWAFLSNKQLLVMSFGVRHELHDADVLWVPAADSYLQGILLHELFGTESPLPGSPSGNDPASQFLPGLLAEQGARFDQYMVSSFIMHKELTKAEQDAEFQQMKKVSSNAYHQFHEHTGNKALVCLGSVKSNGMCELAISRAFGATPWISQDDIPIPTQRACPFFFRYRNGDNNVPSCQGGKTLAADLSGQKLTSDVAGMYFEHKPQEWRMIPSNSQREPALIFYTYRPPVGVVEVVLGGFSTWGTFLLAKHFSKIVEDIWPPTFQSAGLEVGAFIVDFELKANGQSGKPAEPPIDLRANIPEIKSHTVHRLPEEVLAPRLANSELL